MPLSFLEGRKSILVRVRQLWGSGKNDAASGQGVGGSLIILASDWLRNGHVTQWDIGDVCFEASGKIFIILKHKGHALHFWSDCKNSIAPMEGVLVYNCCGNKLPQTWWFKTAQIIFFKFRSSEVPQGGNQDVGRAVLPLETPGEILFSRLFHLLEPHSLHFLAHSSFLRLQGQQSSIFKMLSALSSYGFSSMVKSPSASLLEGHLPLYLGFAWVIQDTRPISRFWF